VYDFPQIYLAGFEKERIKEILKLKDTQYVILNHPVGYLKK
jgi:hypothetical protein